MPRELSPEEFNQLMAMQTLCASVEDDVRALDAFIQSFRKSERRRAQLLRMYEADWTRLTQERSISRSQQATLDAAVQPGRYNVIAQDTVWNALDDAHQLRLALLKLLARSI